MASYFSDKGLPEPSSKVSRSTSDKEAVDLTDFLTSAPETLESALHVFEGLRGQAAGQNGFLDSLIQELMQDVQSSGDKKRPTSVFFRKNLPSVKKKAALVHSSTCPICVIEFKFDSSDSYPRQLPCKHAFHESCLVPWLVVHNTCPTCRLELPTDDPQYEKERKARARANKTPGWEDIEDPYYG